MTEPQRLSRRRFLGTAAAGSLAVAGLGALAPRARSGTSGQGLGERLVPPGKLSIQHFSIRDSITRRSIARSRALGLTPTMGYLGGPDFPEDPTDLGPLLPLPGGFQEVFEFLAGHGFRGFEFFQFSQHVDELGRQPTHAEIRSYLDAAGLTSTGTHTGGLGVMYDPVTGGLSANGQLQVQIAQTLGHTIIGTAGDPSGRATLGDSPTNPNQIGWTEAARRANVVGAILAGLGMRWYWHTEQNGWQFFNDPAHPELSRTHRIDWWNANTDASLVFYEPDIFHSYSGRARFPDPVDGSKWDAFGFWQANSHRLVGWHVKDGTRLASNPAPPTNPFTQVIVRPPHFAPPVPPALANNDALYAGEGTIAKGYPFDPDAGVVGFKKIFDEVGNKGAKFSILETDSGIGGASDPGRSLRHAKLGSAYLFGLRAGPSTHGSHGVEDETVFESDLELAG